ncbi:hypothetical protein BU26DRAFT_559138 [Trematosphaeria pertusa]|uniref:Uncharacterized protein n=1 Tax=Trematosphaeria pertusa TaxID=390896 RepID=A0A6A6IZ48_9PLEO|nr:uncharacterized protein BU26DRAFT_559138 [Trematosphaeria pertusa]KAF2254453.1 hypothetical protein BU26DRAFT_559138 [Trematosphaeria pertusa]
MEPLVQRLGDFSLGKPSKSEPSPPTSEVKPEMIQVTNAPPTSTSTSPSMPSSYGALYQAPQPRSLAPVNSPSATMKTDHLSIATVGARPSSSRAEPQAPVQAQLQPQPQSQLQAQLPPQPRPQPQPQPGTKVDLASLLFVKTYNDQPTCAFCHHELGTGHDLWAERHLFRRCGCLFCGSCIYMRAYPGCRFHPSTEKPKLLAYHACQQKPSCGADHGGVRKMVVYDSCAPSYSALVSILRLSVIVCLTMNLNHNGNLSSMGKRITGALPAHVYTSVEEEEKGMSDRWR